MFYIAVWIILGVHAHKKKSFIFNMSNAGQLFAGDILKADFSGDRKHSN